MATVITPGTSNESSSSFLMGIIILVVAVVLFLLFGLPAIRNNDGGTNVTVPERVDVNVNNPSGSGQ
jgi:hypothetical protein